jgi:hypothetical protein
MQDNSPRPWGRKRALIAPLVIFVLLVAIIAIALSVNAHRQKLARAPVAPAPALAPAPAPAAMQDLPVPPLDRADLVQDANAAAAAYSNAATSSPIRSPLIGRRFVVRIPFGCNGPGAPSATGQADVELDPATNTLKLLVRPSIWTNLPVVQDLATVNKIETVEGFWIPRPWVNSEACPPKRDVALPATPTPIAAQTVGLARIFEKGGSRILMRGDQPYQFSRKLGKDDAELLSDTYRLVLEGRLVGFGNGQASHCWSESADHRPICLYAVEYDRVAFEDARTGAVLAEWRA